MLLSDVAYDLTYVREAILEWWTTIEAFMKHGIGYCILDQNRAVCSCVTSFMTDEEMESHIMTMPEHQGRGLATSAVTAFVKEAKEKNYKLHWDCMEKNHGSRALAEKHGFKKSYDYTLFEFLF